MPYSWITPVTNRTSESFYNYSDVNRVDNNIRYLEEYVNANVGLVATLQNYTTQDNSKYGSSDLINLLEGNINTVKEVLSYDPPSWVTLAESWLGDNNDSFIFTDAKFIDSKD
jgi:hypothetical protein